jgi:hypothetical protein
MQKIVDFFIMVSVRFPRNFFKMNWHMLLHVPEFIKFYGPLINVSAFAFERFEQTLRGHVHSSLSPEWTCVKRHMIMDAAQSYRRTAGGLMQEAGLQSHTRVQQLELPACAFNDAGCLAVLGQAVSENLIDDDFNALIKRLDQDVPERLQLRDIHLHALQQGRTTSDFHTWLADHPGLYIMLLCIT